MNATIFFPIYVVREIRSFDSFEWESILIRHREALDFLSVSFHFLFFVFFIPWSWFDKRFRFGFGLIL
jgi:hypothetical protein